MDTLNILENILDLYQEEKQKQAKRRGLPTEKIDEENIYTRVALSNKQISLELIDLDFKEYSPYVTRVKNLIESYLKDLQYVFLQEENREVVYILNDLSKQMGHIRVNLIIKPKE